MDLAALQDFWAKEIEPALRRAGYDLDDRPSYQDLLDVGYGGIQYTLREHHDMTLSEFLESVGYFEDADENNGYNWDIDTETTVDELHAYIRTLRRRRRRLSDSTINTRRSRLAKYVRIYEDIHGDAAIVDRATDPSLNAEEIQRALAVFDEINHEIDSNESKLRYLEAVDLFYRHLMRREKAAYNPVASFDEEYDWQQIRRDNPALKDDDVQTLYADAESLSERILVLALCGWGLRRGEVASLHVSQLTLETDDPHIYFENRKNITTEDGGVTVPIIYGRETIIDRVEQFSTRDEWNGYIFPSSSAAAGHVRPATIAARFERLVKRAGITVRGETPTPQYGRRFWYTTYRNAVSEFMGNQMQFIADEQGSSDPMVVFRNYLSEDERREIARELMRERLEEVFDSQ